MADDKKGSGKGPVKPGGRKPSTAQRPGLRSVERGTGKGVKPSGVGGASGVGSGSGGEEKEKPRMPHGAAMALLEAVGIDRVCALIIECQSQASIARQLGIGVSTLCEWLSDLERSARARAARVASAENYYGKAEDAILNPDLTDAQRRELAQHYRKEAAVRKPSEFGEKLEVSGDISVSSRDPLSLESFLLMSGLLATANARRLATVPEPLTIELKPGKQCKLLESLRCTECGRC